MNHQLRLNLTRDPAYRRENFVVSPVNAVAQGLLDGWRLWPAGVAALVGPEGSGKTHLAQMWAQDADAVIVRAALGDFTPLQGRPILIENADAWPDEDALFHLINMAAAGGALLLTSRTAPRDWSADLPDLRSRLNGLQVIEIGAPDDDALAGMVRNLLTQRNIVPADDLIPYLLSRMERSYPAAQDLVARLDETAQARGREVNRALAIEVLEVDNVTFSLFD